MAFISQDTPIRPDGVFMKAISFLRLFPVLILVLFISNFAIAGNLEEGMAFYEKQQYKEAFPLIEKAAQTSKMSERGDGTTKNYTKAASRGVTLAQKRLAAMQWFLS